MTQHTPPPWYRIQAEIYSAPDRLLLTMGDVDWPCENGKISWDREQEANAALVLASPYLLEACRAIVRATSRLGQKSARLSRALSQATAAIEMAELEPEPEE